MKAEELMIGDWVYAPGGYMVVGHINPEFLYWDDIEPIPLTPEILEKNRFRINYEGELHTTYFQDVDGFAVEIKIDCIGFTKLSMSNGLGYRVVIECKYVHQLQHALRLCGIDKKIEL